MSVAPIITKYGAAPGESPGAVSFGGGPSQIPIMQGQPMSTLIVPPGGFPGFAQQTMATQAMFQRAGRTGGLRSARKRRRKRGSTKTRANVPRKRRAKGRAKKARLVKGSRAAKAYMAKIRRKRRR